MKDGTIPEELRKHEIAQCVTIVKGGGDLPKISVFTTASYKLTAQRSASRCGL
jgi:hypothetical protein